MKTELEIRNEELKLAKRAQNINLVKFCLGVLLLGLLAFGLNLKQTSHQISNDDRNFLISNFPASEDPYVKKADFERQIRIFGKESDFLNEQLSLANSEIDLIEKEIEEKKQKRLKELAKNAQEKEAARAAEEEARKAKEIAAAKVKRQKFSAMKERDRLLQEAYPSKDLFEIKRQGGQVN